MTRENGRKADALRELTIEPDFLDNPHGSALITQGKTKVLCTAMIQEEVPRWLRKSGRGWITAEYSLLPASTGDRVEREASRGKRQGRTVAIQRLIGRSLRSVVDFRQLGERTADQAAMGGADDSLPALGEPELEARMRDAHQRALASRAITERATGPAIAAGPAC